MDASHFAAAESLALSRSNRESRRFCDVTISVVKNDFFLKGVFLPCFFVFFYR